MADEPVNDETREMVWEVARDLKAALKDPVIDDEFFLQLMAPEDDDPRLRVMTRLCSLPQIRPLATRRVIDALLKRGDREEAMKFMASELIEVDKANPVSVVRTFGADGSVN